MGEGVTFISSTNLKCKRVTAQGSGVDPGVHCNPTSLVTSPLLGRELTMITISIVVSL